LWKKEKSKNKKVNKVVDSSALVDMFITSILITLFEWDDTRHILIEVLRHGTKLRVTSGGEEGSTAFVIGEDFSGEDY